MDSRFLIQQLSTNGTESLSEIKRRIENTLLASNLRLHVAKDEACYLLALAMKESGFGINMRNPRSSATGWHQMLKGTYAGLSNQFGLNDKTALSFKDRLAALGVSKLTLAQSRTDRTKVLCDLRASTLATQLAHRYLHTLIVREFGKKAVHLTADGLEALLALGHHLPAFMKKVLNRIPKGSTVDTALVRALTSQLSSASRDSKMPPMLYDLDKFLKCREFASEIVNDVWA